MSQKRSKKKRSPRERFMLREQLKIEEGVFDNRTMLRLGRLFTHDIISRLEFIIAKGKEADVYIADAGSKIKADFVAVKIFRIETSGFSRRLEYIKGDPRFEKIKGNVYNIVNEWCKKEYGNLKLAQDAKVHAPTPYFFSGNVLAMGFIGTEGRPSQSLKKTKVSNPEAVLDIVIEDMARLYRIGLVHADVSEYNILMKDETPYLIDFGQAVVLGHASALNFLRRDVSNVLSYFKKTYGIERDPEGVYGSITGSQAL